jgi:putative ABC transport system permease protein
MKRFLRRILALALSRRDDRELGLEMDAHLALLEDEYRRRGMTTDDAALAARRAMGSVALATDRQRDARSFRWVADLRRDLVHIRRGLQRTPVFTTVAVLTVALGVGANVAIFGVVYQTLVKPLPFDTPDRLVTVSTSIPKLASRFPLLPVAANDFLEYRRSNTVFTDLCALQARNFNLTGTAEPERLHGAVVSQRFFPMLGSRPDRGRNFAPDEDVEGRDAVVIISHALWERRFGSNPAIVGRSILLDGHPHAIIGVMPADLLFPVGRQLDPLITFGPRVDLWKPLVFSRDELAQEGNFDFAVIGRLKPGVGIAAAEQQMNVLAARNMERIRKKEPIDLEVFTRIRSLHDVFTGQSRRGLLILEAAVGLLLLIACVNLANVFLARATARAQEFAVRIALGAGRGRLVRQMLTESLVVTGLGGAIGTLIALSIGPLLLRYGPRTAAAGEWTLSAPVLVFAAVTAIATGLLFGIVPALDASRDGLGSGSSGAARGVVGGRTGRLRTTLITVEVALCTGLLAVAGLLLHSFVNVTSVDRGFASERVLAVDLSLPEQQYTEEQAIAFYRDLVARVRALPGVTAAGAIDLLPIAHEGIISTILLDTDTTFRLDRPPALRRSLTPGLFAAMETPLRAGRLFAEHEPQPVAIINETLAHKLWPNAALASVVGRGIRRDPEDPLMTVVGVVGDVRAEALDREPPATLYHPIDQSRRRAMSLVVKTTIDPLSMASSIRTTVNALDRNLPIAAMRTMQDVVSASVSERRFQMVLVALFALLALALAVVGVYGITSYAVARRTREIGLRVALGAERPHVLRSVMGEGLRPVLAGLLLGGIAAQIAVQPVRSVLFGVGPLDPVALIGVASLLLLTAMVACYVPARRATRVDPMVALRSE